VCEEEPPMLLAAYPALPSPQPTSPSRSQCRPPLLLHPSAQTPPHPHAHSADLHPHPHSNLHPKSHLTLALTFRPPPSLSLQPSPQTPPHPHTHSADPHSYSNPLPKPHLTLWHAADQRPWQRVAGRSMRMATYSWTPFRCCGTGSRLVGGPFGLTTCARYPPFLMSCPYSTRELPAGG